MYAVEFETNIQEGIVKLPEKYSRLKNAHARIVLLIDEHNPDSELHAFSNHTANTIEEWSTSDEDEVWK